MFAPVMIALLKDALASKRAPQKLANFSDAFKVPEIWATLPLLNFQLKKSSL